LPLLTQLKAGLGGSLCESVFVLGLAAVFLANAAVAVVDPTAFTELVSASPIGHIVSGGWVAPAIALNDLCIGVALLTVHRLRWLRPPVLAWAGLWLMLVRSLSSRMRRCRREFSVQRPPLRRAC